MSIKYVFITGGVVSSLGKGLTSASIAKLLEERGLKIDMLKLDPYLNVDPGTMSPFQHGEVYVTDDGAETDLDLGHYHRFTNAKISRLSNATSGQIYEEVIKRERKGDYLGKTVQVIPHVTDEIKRRILLCAKQQPDTQVVFVEIGGTVGDIESLPFLEAIRQFRNEHPKDCLNIHLTYVPYLQAAGEVKTKPTQHSVQMLRSIGIFPDMILCRCENPLAEELKDKISLFCNVPKEAVIDEVDVKHTIYEVPLYLKEENIDEMICEKFNLKTPEPSLKKWKKMVETIINPPNGEVTVGIVGKYIDHSDAYKSVFESLEHGAIASNLKLNIKRIESDKITNDNDAKKHLQGCDGYLVPGGFGERGWKGKILTAKYCRENSIPFFGICLGLQAMLVEFAKYVLKYDDADSLEHTPTTKHPVISLLEEQKQLENLGGTMRLGSYPCELKENSLAYKAYQKKIVHERHRHRYEFNSAYKDEYEKAGMIFTGILENGSLCEIAEVKNHPWMLGVQFHPEFTSKPTDPNPLFKDFIAAVYKHKKKK
jgi:CTP synthase